VGLHEALRRGDFDAAVDAFTDVPQGATNGMPRRVAALREFFSTHRDALKKRRAELREARVLIDPKLDRFWRWVDGKKVSSKANALVLPVKCGRSGGLGMAPPNAQSWLPHPDTLFMMYALIQGEDGNWRIVHDRALPDPNAEAYHP